MVETAVTSALACWGLSLLALLPLLLFSPWQPIRHMAAYFGDLVLGIKARRKVRPGLRKTERGA